MDIKTLYMISTIILSFASIILILNYRKNPQNDGVKYLTYFIILHLIGFILFLLRNQIPDFISIVLANTLFAVGTISLFLAIKALVKIEPILHKRYLLPVFTYFIGFVLFTYVTYDTKTRMLIYYIFCTMYLLPSSWLLWINKSSKYKLFDKLTSILFFTISFILIWMITQVSFITLHSYIFTNSNIFMMIGVLIIYMFSLWSLLALKYRIKN